MKKIKFLSLFTGIGGLDLGLEGGFAYLGQDYERTGLESVFACDIKPSAKKVFDAYQAKRKRELTLTLASIVDLVKEHEHKGSILPAADVVIGGFPCGDFSHCGLRAGFKSHKNHRNEVAADIPTEETRGMLYYWMMRTIIALRPKVFIAENVKGILTAKVGPWTALERIKSDFGTVGYKVESKMVNAREHGVPQNRERAIIIGVRTDINKKGLKPMMLAPAPLFGMDITCNTAFVGLDEPPNSPDPSQNAYSKAAYMGDGQGQTEIDLYGVAPTIRSEHHGNIEYRRLTREHGGRLRDEINSGMPERRLTVRECARLQSFPDDMEFVPLVSASEAYKLIGNAVPPLLGHAIGQGIREYL